MPLVGHSYHKNISASSSSSSGLTTFILEIENVALESEKIFKKAFNVYSKFLSLFLREKH